MVFQKRLNYGSSGGQVAAMPHFPRSAKGKRSVRRKTEDNQMCAFDLLVTVAGQLLEGGNLGTPFITTGASSPTIAKHSVKQVQSHTVKPVKVEVIEDGSFLKEHSPARLTVSGHASVFTNSDASDKDGRRDDVGISYGLIVPDCSLERCPNGPKKSWECKVEDGINLEDPIDVNSKPLAWLSSDSSVEFPLHGVRIARSGSFDERGISMKLPVNRDDDERSSGATHPSTKAFKSHRIGDRRIRKLLASKYWKVSPTMFKDAEVSDTERKLILRGRKLCYTRPRTQRCLFKRRKLSERNNVGLCGEGKSNSPINGSTKVEPKISLSELNEATGAFSSTSVKDPSYDSGDIQVKFSIKSFKVPELFIEMPKSATVGSLKRTVMDAVTAALGDGLHVGVYLQGKKVRDNNKTLLEAGISHADKLDNLGFTLEPSPNKAPAPLTPPHEEPRFILPCDSTFTLTSIPADLEASNGPMPEPSPSPNCPESDHDSVQSPTDGSSRALVPVTVPTARVESLAVIPLIRKAKRSDLVQRRIRRPFSVSEVEALVQAVEKLGTGRWRDVKIGAFDCAKHRTYVDLKDKWKTLVHTATISPQQRRGEPVPQELLDRVLAAHAYWTENQTKAQVKPPTSTGEPMLLI